MIKGIENLITIINNAWPSIIVIIGLSILLFNRIKNYLKLSKEEKVNAALVIIKAELLKLMSDAEIEWENYQKSGELKKSQVIAEIYEKFPFLANYVTQDDLIEQITQMINEEKEKMDKIINGIPVDCEDTDVTALDNTIKEIVVEIGDKIKNTKESGE